MLIPDHALIGMIGSEKTRIAHVSIKTTCSCSGPLYPTLAEREALTKHEKAVPAHTSIESSTVNHCSDLRGFIGVNLNQTHQDTEVTVLYG